MFIQASTCALGWNFAANWNLIYLIYFVGSLYLCSIQLIRALFRSIQPSDFSVFDPLGLNKESSLGLGAFWESVLDFFSQTFESTASSKKDKSSSKRGVAGYFFLN